MDSSLRKRFMSPLTISRTTERSKLDYVSSSWRKEQWSTQPPTPRSSCRSEEKMLKSVNQISESISERGPRQKVSRSLFSIKARDVEQQPLVERWFLPERQFLSEKEKMCKRSNILSSNFPETDKERTSISLVELAVPELLTEAYSMDLANDYIALHVVLGQYDEVEVYPSDFSELLKPETVDKFKLAISPIRVHPPYFPSLSQSITESVNDSLGFQGFDSEAARLPKEKEMFVDVHSLGGLRSRDFPMAKRTTNEGYSGLPKSEEYSLQNPCMGKTLLPDVSTSQKKMIKGFSVPRCSRLTNQPYQAQAIEFEEILSSKVRQIAEVADCLQHKELLYKILQF